MCIELKTSQTNMHDIIQCKTPSGHFTCSLPVRRIFPSYGNDRGNDYDTGMKQV